MGDSLSFTIKPAVANGKIVGLGVLDVATNELFTYQSGVWNKAPEVTPGTGNLKISVTVRNTANTTGNVTTIISLSGTSLYYRHTERLLPNYMYLVEGIWDMPSGEVTVSITVNDTV